MVKKIVIVSTSAPSLQGHPTGLWIEELASPYYAWKEAGYEVVIASTKGGPIPLDAASMDADVFSPSSQKLMHDKEAVHGLSHSLSVKEIDWSTVDAIFLPGGHGTCVDFVQNRDLAKATETMYNKGKIVSSVCHGPIALCDCKLEDGTTPLVAGKTVTGFSDEEENMVQLQAIVPFLLESKLKELGANYEKGDNWTSKVCVDGNLVTGQNPQSSEAVAKAVIELLG